MSFYRKAIDIWITAFCLLAVWLLALLFPVTAYASADSVTATFRINQVFTKNSSASDVNDVFTYTLISLDAGNPMPAGSVGGSYSFTIDGTRIVNIDPITFTNTGIYRYAVHTDPSFAEIGYICDKQVYTVTVYVSRPVEDLKTEIIIQKNNGSKTNSLKFENSYTPIASDPAIMVDPPVKKTVTGSPSQAGTFLFTLTAGNPANPMPAGSVNGVKTITIVGAGEKDFGTWEYTKEGTYYYTISEVNTGEARYTYDDTVYTITDVVKDVDGQLEVSRTVTNGAVKQVQACTYINKYGEIAARGPKTGDDTMSELYTFLLWAGIAVIVGCILFLIIAGKRKKEDEEERCWE